MHLQRIRIMNIRLGRLKTGNYRNVTEKEIEELNQLISKKNQVNRSAEKNTK
jgi:23S rRNA pseudouridine2604 synthase